MRLIRYGVLTLILGLALTLVSSGIYAELPPPYPDNAYAYVDDDRTLVAAGGWPFPYARDGAVSSPTRHADIIGVWVTSDEFIKSAFLKTYAFWQIIAGLFGMALFAMRRQKAK